MANSPLGISPQLSTSPRLYHLAFHLPAGPGRCYTCNTVDTYSPEKVVMFVVEYSTRLERPESQSYEKRRPGDYSSP
jgi:hypothetical protein